MRYLTEREIAGLRVIITGGSDGKGGGEGPLVVLLHGFGAPGRDLVPLSQVMSVPTGTRFAFPAAPLSLADSFGGGRGFEMFDSRAWWMIDIERFERVLGQLGPRARSGMPNLNDPLLRSLTDDVPAGLAPARTQLLSVLDELERQLHVPPGQMVLGGFSQGSMLSLDVALRSERKLAGLLLWSSTLICQPEWDPRMASRRGLPILQSHGQQDPLLPFFLAEALRDKLTAAGAAVHFVPFRGAHEIPQAVLRATDAFLHKVLATPQTGHSDHG